MKQYWRMLLQTLRKQPGIDTPLVRWGLLICITIVLWSIIIVPYMDWRDLQQNLIASKARKALKLEALKASSHAWNRAVKAHNKAMTAVSHKLFQGSSYASAQAALFRLMTGKLAAEHLHLDSQRLLDEVTIIGFGQKIGVQFRVHGKRMDVMHFLDTVGRMNQLLVLEKVYLNQPANSRTDMLLNFEVSSFRLGAK